MTVVITVASAIPRTMASCSTMAVAMSPVIPMRTPPGAAASVAAMVDCTRSWRRRDFETSVEGKVARTMNI